MKKILLQFLAVLSVVSIVSCNSCNKDKSRVAKEKLTEKDSVTIKIHRYEKALFSVDLKNLKKGLAALCPEYSFFISDSSLKDTLSISGLRSYLTDPVIVDAYKQTIKTYPDVIDLEKDLGKALTFFKHYYPEKKIPTVFTMVNGMDTRFPVTYLDSILIIALDMYLGSDYESYKGLGVPQFMLKRFKKEYIVTDCMMAIGSTLVDNSKENLNLLDHMIYQGKLLYFIDAMMPDTPDSTKIKYSGAQMNWCKKNEANMWGVLIEKKILYSQQLTIIKKLCGDGPFTAMFSKQSPSRVGYWIGWQIVRMYMENNPKVTLKELFRNQDSQNILSRSKYKPKKEA